ncbi:TlpA disulfide reductase family protein [Pedobacter sp. L105]|uniref:TlpA disulfide reductase family protein n=1 Tax=Pedobacter sp. L105 TaxID=1641871 RepID=UPI00131E939D|nr:TlpA disulfide reductase family protein [Pedobacter sp. L105]
MKIRSLMAGIICLAVPGYALAQSDTFIVHGKVNTTHNGEMIHAVYRNGKVLVQDSTVVKDGKFTITGKLSAPDEAYIRLGKKQPPNYGDFYLSPGEINISATDSMKYATVSGNQLAIDYARLRATLEPIAKEKLSYTLKFLALPVDQRKTPEAKELAGQAQKKGIEMNNAIFDFIAKNPQSYVSLDYLQKIAGAVIDYSLIMPKFEKLSDNLKNSALGKAFHEKILEAKVTEIGSVAKSFESVTPDGKKLSLKEVEVQGKYTLIDFWASWCGPCRKENPNVVNAYTMYHDKGLNILSVSLDTNPENWKEAIAKDGMPWNHVSSLLGWKEPAAELYDVKAIPQNILVDSKGVIVAKNLRGEELLEKLKELL